MTKLSSYDFPGLDRFIERALDFGRTQTASSSGACHNLRIAHKTIRFSESAPLLADAASYCLGRADAEKQPFTHVYAEYSDWHIRAGFQEVFRGIAGLSPLVLDTHLRAMGWRANLDVLNGRCDIFEISTRFGIRFMTSPSAQPVWERTAPLASFCNWIGEAQGLTMVHAAAIALADKGALLVGNGGAGKSATTLACLLGGLSSAGDDYTFISPAGAEATYSTVKQGLEGLNRLGISAIGTPNWQNKYVFRPEEIGARPIAHHVPLSAIFMPRIGATRTTLVPITQAEPFKVLTLSTLKQLGSGYKELFTSCGPLLRELPCFTLHLSADPEEIVETISRALKDL